MGFPGYGLGWGYPGAGLGYGAGLGLGAIPGCGIAGYSIGYILVLFILLVIIARPGFWI